MHLVTFLRCSKNSKPQSPIKLIAVFYHRCVPRNEAIDLLNVAFEQQPVRNSVKPRHKRTDTDPKKDPFDVPDRITGRAGIKELSQSRTWNFVEVRNRQLYMVSCF